MDRIIELIIPLVLAIAGISLSAFKTKKQRQNASHDNSARVDKSSADKESLERALRGFFGKDDPFDFGEKRQEQVEYEGRIYPKAAARMTQSKTSSIPYKNIGRAGDHNYSDGYIEQREIREMREAGSLEAKYARSIDTIEHPERYKSNVYKCKLKPEKTLKKGSYSANPSDHKSNRIMPQISINEGDANEDLFAMDLALNSDTAHELGNGWILNDFDIKKAIIYSEIIEPKFFKEEQ